MRVEKELMVEEIYRQVESSQSMFVANFMGLKAQELEEFRNQLKPLSSDCMIVKNTLLSRAIQKASLPSLDEHLKGPTAVIFGRGDDVAVAKRVMQFIKDHELLKIKVGIVEKNVIAKEQITFLASLPGREVLIAKVVGSLKSPLFALVGVLSALQRGLVVALAAIQEKKEKSEQSTVAAAAENPAQPV